MLEEAAEGLSPAGGMNKAPRSESTLGVLGSAVLLAVTAGAIAVVLLSSALSKTGSIDGAEIVGGVFRDGEVPFSLELQEATKFPTQETVIKLALPEGGTPEEGAPAEIVLLLFPKQEAARSTFETGSAQSFGGPSSGDATSATRDASANLIKWQEDPSFAWHTPIKDGSVAWSRWKVDYRIERAFHEGGEWHDSVRLDLCQPGRSLLLYAQFAPEFGATEEMALELARSIEMIRAE